jgi:hypothetical protein
MSRKSLSSLVLFLLISFGAASAHAQCPAGQFYLDLKNCTTGTMAGVSFLSACAPAAVSAACPAANWKQAVLRIAIPNGCTQANVVVEWEGLPAGFTVNLGDSRTNDAFAGDAGTTTHNAEMWILNEDMAVANGSGSAAAIDNPLLFLHLSLTDSAMKFVVKNQFFSWGQPYGILQTPASKNLFAIPDTTVAAADQRAIFLGLNEVITGRADRKGCGARRALVTFK